MHLKQGTLTKSKLTSKELKEKWRLAFAADLSNEKRTEIYFEDFLWHAFSYEKLECIRGDEARKVFDEKKKKSVYIFYQHKEEVYKVESAENIKASDFDTEDDVYLLDTDMKWTYIHTHEIQCGPYFKVAFMSINRTIDICD